MHKNTAIKETVHRHGKEFLLYYCESLSHRLLKTPVKDRSLTVADFIKKCELFAADLIPGQDFRPMDKLRIKMAKVLDASSLGRLVFRWYKKFS